MYSSYQQVWRVPTNQPQVLRRFQRILLNLFAATPMQNWPSTAAASWTASALLASLDLSPQSPLAKKLELLPTAIYSPTGRWAARRCSLRGLCCFVRSNSARKLLSLGFPRMVWHFPVGGLARAASSGAVTVRSFVSALGCCLC